MIESGGEGYFGLGTGCGEATLCVWEGGRQSTEKEAAVCGPGNQERSERSMCKTS